LKDRRRKTQNRRVSRGKIVLITGATRGLGRAMAEEFARLGHTVLGCGRSSREIEKLRK
jgi:NAD(P)-dependent dehydrogenase (short-subunit alcohol dehydrogenase family)